MFRGDAGEQVKTQLKAKLANFRATNLVVGGRAAAKATVDGMQATFDKIKPREIVDAYDNALNADMAKGDILSMLWKTFGPRTIDVMADGCKLLALLWQSAWIEGSGDRNITDLTACNHPKLSGLYVKKSTLPSYLLTEIKDHLKSAGGSPGALPKKTSTKKAAKKQPAKRAAKRTPARKAA